MKEKIASCSLSSINRDIVGSKGTVKRNVCKIEGEKIFFLLLILWFTEAFFFCYKSLSLRCFVCLCTNYKLYVRQQCVKKLTLPPLRKYTSCLLLKKKLFALPNKYPISVYYAKFMAIFLLTAFKGFMFEYIWRMQETWRSRLADDKSLQSRPCKLQCQNLSSY